LKMLGRNKRGLKAMSVETDPYFDKRTAMVADQIRARGVRSKEVLHAMEMVPRHRFVPEDLRWAAYEDRPLEIGYGQTISQPYMVAAMTDALQIFPGCRILEVGTGSGYQAAVLEEMGAYVWTIERHAGLAISASRRLKRLGYRHCSVRVGDGGNGWKEYAPFDRVIVSAAAPRTPAALAAQTQIGGIIVIPVGSRTLQNLAVMERMGMDEFHTEKIMKCMFVPLLGAEGWSNGSI
jgi:protein-L-isoaspartate(D-aspartate) O-methyltransferase